MIPQGQHLGAQIPQVLRHQGKAGDFPVQGIQHSVPRRLDPCPLHGGGAGGGNLPVGVKGPEMVDADDVKQLLVIADPLDPEIEVVLFQVVPIVDGVAPPLAHGAEVIRRDACNIGRPSGLVQQEVFLAGPDVHRVDPHIEGHVPHDADSFFPGYSPHHLPLAEELVLQKQVVVDLLLVGA